MGASHLPSFGGSGYNLYKQTASIWINNITDRFEQQQEQRTNPTQIHENPMRLWDRLLVCSDNH